jgi:hypothetical protein
MGSFAYELGKSAAIGPLLQGIGQGIGRTGAQYAKSWIPRLGTKALKGVAVSPKPVGAAQGLASAGRGAVHGLTRGRWPTPGVVGETPFRYGRAAGKLVRRHPYATTMALGSGVPYYNPLAAEGERFGTAGGMGLIPQQAEDLIWSGLLMRGGLRNLSRGSRLGRMPGLTSRQVKGLGRHKLLGLGEAALGGHLGWQGLKNLRGVPGMSPEDLLSQMTDEQYLALLQALMGAQQSYQAPAQGYGAQLPVALSNYVQGLIPGQGGLR